MSSVCCAHYYILSCKHLCLRRSCFVFDSEAFQDHCAVELVTVHPLLSQQLPNSLSVYAS